jgi:hypothetical protein
LRAPKPLPLPQIINVDLRKEEGGLPKIAKLKMPFPFSLAQEHEQDLNAKPGVESE